MLTVAREVCRPVVRIGSEAMRGKEGEDRMRLGSEKVNPKMGGRSQR
jgi:hypothetical protein